MPTGSLRDRPHGGRQRRRFSLQAFDALSTELAAMMAPSRIEQAPRGRSADDLRSSAMSGLGMPRESTPATPLFPPLPRFSARSQKSRFDRMIDKRPQVSRHPLPRDAACVSGPAWVRLGRFLRRKGDWCLISRRPAEGTVVSPLGEKRMVRCLQLRTGHWAVPPPCLGIAPACLRGARISASPATRLLKLPWGCCYPKRGIAPKRRNPRGASRDFNHSTWRLNW